MRGAMVTLPRQHVTPLIKINFVAVLRRDGNCAIIIRFRLQVLHTGPIATHVENKKHKIVAQNNSIIHDITSIARCKCQQNVLTKLTEIKIKTSNW